MNDCPHKKACSVITDAVLHEATGLQLMPRSNHQSHGLKVSHTVAIPPACCPVSKNPKEGSTLTLSYSVGKQTLEVYSLRSLLQKFVGGWRGNDVYPPERNMEGLVELVAQMVADALRRKIEFSSHVVMDCGEMTISGTAYPR